jgi:hypothetical protein
LAAEEVKEEGAVVGAAPAVVAAKRASELVETKGTTVISEVREGDEVVEVSGVVSVPSDLSAAAEQEDLVPLNFDDEEPSPVRANFATVGGKADIDIEPTEIMSVLGEPLLLKIQNEGLVRAELRIEVVESKMERCRESATNLLVSSPASVTLPAAQEEVLTLSYVRPKLDRERTFRVKVVQVSETERKAVAVARGIPTA